MHIIARKGGRRIDTINLQRIDNNQSITRENNGEFLYEYQKAVLLALVESGRLTEIQYRYAEEKLMQQRYEFERRRASQ